MEETSHPLNCYLKLISRLLRLEIEDLQNKMNLLHEAEKHLEEGNEVSAVEALEKIGIPLEDEYDAASFLLRLLIKKRLGEYRPEEVWAVFEGEFVPQKQKDHDYLVNLPAYDFSNVFWIIKDVESSEVLTELERLHIYSEVEKDVRRWIREMQNYSSQEGIMELIIEELENWFTWSEEEMEAIEKAVDTMEIFDLIKIIRKKVIEEFEEIRERYNNDLDIAKRTRSKLGIKSDGLSLEEWANLISKAESIEDLRNIANLIGFSLETHNDLVWSTYINKLMEITEKLKRGGFEGWKTLLKESHNPKDLAVYYFELCFDPTLSEAEREELWSLIERKLF